MKTAKKHWRQRYLTRRVLFEHLGLVILIALSVSQRSLIADALSSFWSSNRLLFFYASMLFWFMPPITPLSYQILAHKKLPLHITVLAQLAGAGPGRVIPGGLGRLSFGALNLHKLGLNLQRSIIITATNNIIGLIVNSVLFGYILLTYPQIREAVIDNINSRTLPTILIVLFLLISTILWLSHVKAAQKFINKLKKQSVLIGADLLKNPLKSLLLVTLAIAILFGHVAIMYIVSQSVSAHLTISDIIIALSVGVAVGGLLPTPGGIGGVEAGTITILVLLGYDATQATTVTLLFRAITYWQPLLPGLAAYLYLRKRQLL